MKAIVHYRYGSPNDVLEVRDIEKPVVKDGEVLVRVLAAAVQAGDWVIARGVPYLARPMYGLLKPKNTVAGTDIAGQVEAVGENVKQFQPGDEVFGWCSGAFAEYVCAAANNLVPKPMDLTFEQAAAIPGSAITALQALRDQGKVKSGQKVLIIGASGGVGTFAVQIAKSFGAEVTGMCSTRNVDMVRSIGADYVIDYTQEDFTRRGQSYDLILDLAGNRPLSHLRQALTREGTLVLIGGRGGPWTMGMGRTFRALLLSPFVSQQLRFFVAAGNNEDLVVLKELVEAGKVTPVIDRSYALNETPAAVGYVEAGHARGKVVITVAHNAKG